MLVGIAVAAVLSACGQQRSEHRPGPARRAAVVAPRYPSTPDFGTIRVIAQLRGAALRHSWQEKVYAGRVGTQELLSLHTFTDARCAQAVTLLFGEMLDLGDAYKGEDWTVALPTPDVSVCRAPPPGPFKPVV